MIHSTVHRAVLATTALALLAACGTTGTTGTTSPRPTDSTTGSKVVTLATHDSWAMSKKVIAAFEKQSGYTLKVVPNGDAGVLTNKLVLTQGHPIADAAYGVDNTFASRALEAGVFADYTSPTAAPSAAAYDLPGGTQALTPVDWGDVCVNVDLAWFSAHHLALPTSLDDLADPTYRGLFVTPGAATSSPGFAFLLATIAKYGDGWQDYWTRLMDNDTRIAAGWTDAYEVDFSASGGDRPIVLSYNSSPPFTIPRGKTRPTTKALLDTCFRQVEYAGVLAGASNPDGARALVDFMGSTAFQEALPDQMYVFPVDDAAALPASWAEFAPPATDPFTVDPAEVADQRDTWIRTWSDLTS